MADYICKDCGGDMCGDGYTVVLHCEFIEDDEVWKYHEPDANPIYCGHTDDA